MSASGLARPSGSHDFRSRLRKLERHEEVRAEAQQPRSDPEARKGRTESGKFWRNGQGQNDLLVQLGGAGERD